MCVHIIKFSGLQMDCVTVGPHWPPPDVWEKSYGVDALSSLPTSVPNPPCSTLHVPHSDKGALADLKQTSGF